MGFVRRRGDALDPPSPSDSVLSGRAPGRRRTIVGRFRYATDDGTWWWSPELFALYGHPAGAPRDPAQTTRALLAPLHPDDLSRYRVSLERAAREGTPFAIAHRIIGADGVTRRALVVGQAELDDDGRPAAVLGSVVSVDETAPDGPGSDRVALDGTVGREVIDGLPALAADRSVDGTLDLVLRLAGRIVPAADHIGVTVVRRGRTDTAATTGDVPRRLDRIQSRAGEGPSLQAIADDVPQCVGDLATDGRWPAFAAKAVTETPVRSVLSYRLSDGADPLGALNLYAERADAFQDGIVPAVGVVAAQAGLALSRAIAKERIAHLEHAVVSNRMIGTAIGVLMAHRQITEDVAFGLLRAVSQSEQRKLREIAAEVVLTGVLPELPEPRTAPHPGH